MIARGLRSYDSPISPIAGGRMPAIYSRLTEDAATSPNLERAMLCIPIAAIDTVIRYDFTHRTISGRGWGGAVGRCRGPFELASLSPVSTGDYGATDGPGELDAARPIARPISPTMQKTFFYNSNRGVRFRISD